MASTSSLEFCPELKRLFESQAAVGRSGRHFASLTACSTLNNVLTIRNLMLELKPVMTLEVGLAFGGSALAFAASHRDLGRKAEQQHVAIDPYQQSVWDDSGLVALEKSGLVGFVDFRPTFSWLALPALIGEKKFVDLVYIDGSHLFEDAFVDFYLVSRALQPGGIVLLDDSACPQVAKVVRFITGNMANQFEEVDLLRFRPDPTRKLLYRSARALGRLQLRAFKLKSSSPERPWDASMRRF